ncbi:hypothetical protein [Paraburkholderia sediminicola]
MAYELLTPDSCAVRVGVLYAKSIPGEHARDSNAVPDALGFNCFAF